jgi:predicted Zn-dependent protease
VKRPAVALLALLALACATSPLGRRQLKLFPASEIAQMGATAFDQAKKETPVSRDAAANARVRCVAAAVTRELPGDSGGWEVVVFEDKTANAFALPGRKIGVHTGLLAVAKNQDQLATVIGHEVAHVVADHSNERVSTAFAAQGAAALVGAIANPGAAGHDQLMGLLGLGAQVGVLLPFDRAQESEADMLGLDLMAKAGFDPRESIALWRNMSAAGGSQPPEFLSTHPSHGTRTKQLEARMPSALELQKAARAAGKRPVC